MYREKIIFADAPQVANALECLSASAPQGFITHTPSMAQRLSASAPQQQKAATTRIVEARLIMPCDGEIVRR